jgi:peroxiredoxin Q/BCP
MPDLGSPAPETALLDQNGEEVSLSSFAGRKVLVYFYPKADTPGCTTQACGMRDIIGDIGDTAVLGISPDKPAKQAKFDEKYGLGFPLLADEDHAVADAYGAWQERNNYGRKYWGIVRSSFLVDPDGKVAKAWPRVKADGHAAEVMAALEAQPPQLQQHGTRPSIYENAPDPITKLNNFHVLTFDIPENHR